MKAVRFRQFGTPSSLLIEDVPKPEPGPGEALVQVMAAGINPADVKNVAGHFSATTLPRIPGRDFSGVVVAGTRFPGEEVWGSAPGFGIKRDGVQAEYAVIPEEALSRKPANLTMEQAAAVGVPFTTAWTALMRAGGLQAGETVLIVGGAGAVGQAATQIANWKGAQVIGARRGAGDVPGAAAIIDTNEVNWHERAFALTNGKGADLVLDTVGGPLFEPALRSLRAGGRQIAITSTRDKRVSFDLVAFYHNSLRLIGVDSNALTARDGSEIMDELRPGFEAGALKPPAVQAVGIDEVVDAYQKVASGSGGLKYVIVFGA
jgi:NADPH2:quinone reductase